MSLTINSQFAKSVTEAVTNKLIFCILSFLCMSYVNLVVPNSWNIFPEDIVEEIEDYLAGRNDANHLG